MASQKLGAAMTNGQTGGLTTTKLSPGEAGYLFVNVVISQLVMIKNLSKYVHNSQVGGVPRSLSGESQLSPSSPDHHHHDCFLCFFLFFSVTRCSRSDSGY